MRTPSATSRLASFVCGLDPHGLPAPVVEQAVRCVLDLTGVAVAGTATPLAKISAAFAHEQYAVGEATVIGSRDRRGVVGATWINGACASALDMDDGNRLAMGHPGASVIPAALAVAEQRKASGLQFLTAIVAGYEVAVRASAARVPWYKDKMYSTGIWGVFGAAAAAGKLLAFDENRLQSALGIAGSHGAFPPGGLQANHAMVKETIAWSGMTGVASALLAQRDFAGPSDFFDYTQRWDTAALVAGLDDPAGYAIGKTYFKPYAVCRWAHAAVDAVLALKHRRALRSDEVEGVHVETFSEVTRLANYAPRNTIAAQFSIPFALAVALIHDRIGPAEVSEAHIGDASILALARKVRVTVDADLDREFPAKTIARVTIRARGEDVATTVEYPRGNPENPLSDAELEAKFLQLADDIVGQARSRALLSAIRGLPRSPDVRTFTELLRY
jgi:2-methylcitrate dehydratase PrpD